MVQDSMENTAVHSFIPAAQLYDLISVQIVRGHISYSPYLPLNLLGCGSLFVLPLGSYHLLIPLNSPSATNLQFYYTESHFWGLFACFYLRQCERIQ